MLVVVAVSIDLSDEFNFLYFDDKFRLAASIAAEEDGRLTYSKMMSAAAGLCEEDGDEDEEMMLVCLNWNCICPS